MCGINGFTFGDKEKIISMNASIKHRGPDDDGVFVDHNISLGNTRLAILDLSPLGHQPMFNDEKSIALVFNGEIYNFNEIRKELEKKGYVFRSQSDSEVIIRAYEAYGTDCLLHFNGIFAFAIWDAKSEKLFIARDRVGVKPLYYFWDEKKLIFSSEIKSILQHPVKRELNPDALNIYLRMLYVPAPLTMFKDIQKLEPGTYLSYSKGKLSQCRYWDPLPVKSQVSYGDAVNKVRWIVDDAVRLQLISERPVGVFLSGGVDSTIITALASQKVSHTLKTFSVIYDVKGERFNADAKIARKTSAHFGTEHHELMVTGQDCLKHIENIVYHMDEPASNATQLATYLLSTFARKDVVVALGGDGGDELFGGYQRYRYSQLITAFQKFPKSFRAGLLSLGKKILPRYRPLLDKLDLSPGVQRYMAFMSQKEKDIERIVQNDFNKAAITPSFYNQHFFSKSMLDPEQKFMWADIQSWLPDESLLRSDKMSMAAGLEQRVPLLDHRLVELSLQLPSSYKIRYGRKKSILKDAFSDVLPSFVLNQPKRGWFSPTSHWLRTSLKDMAQEVLSSSYNSGLEHVFSFKGIQQMFEEHLDLKAYHMNLLWALFTFQLWYHQFVKKNLDT